MANYDANDLEWTWDGGFTIGGDGDLGDTSDDLIRSLENEIRTVVRSEFGDWEAFPVLGANISDFRGEPNTKAIAQSIQEQLVSRIVSTGLVSTEDIQVRIVPVHAHAVLIMIAINAVATAGNRFTPGEQLVMSFTYDSLEDSVFFMPPSKTEREAR